MDKALLNEDGKGKSLLNGRFIKSQLKLQGKSQIELAHFAYVRPEHLSRQLNGEVEPRITTIRKIAEFIGVPIEAIVIQPGMVLGEDRTTYTTERAIPVIIAANNQGNTALIEIVESDLPAGFGPYGSIKRCIADTDALGVLLCGNSMAPALPDGTRVIASPMAGFSDGRVHYIHDIHGRHLVRRVERGNECFMLTALNPSYAAIHLLQAEIIQLCLIIAADFPG